MTSAQVVETSVTNNSSFQNYPHPDDHTIRTTDTPGFKPFTTNNSLIPCLFSRYLGSVTLPQRQSYTYICNSGSSVSSNPLAHHLAFLQSQAMADSTHHLYQAGIRRYSTFCASVKWQSFPATETTLCLFAAYFTDQVSSRPSRYTLQEFILLILKTVCETLFRKLHSFTFSCVVSSSP